MRVLFYEIRKAIVSPVILSLLVLFIGFNSYLIYQNSYIKEDLQEANRIANTYGTEINDKMLSSMKNDYKAQMKKVNEVTNRESRKTYLDMNEFYLDTHANSYKPEEMKLFSNTALLEFYYFSSLEIDESFQKMDPVDMAEFDIKMFGINGSAAEFIRGHYPKFNERYQEVQTNSEYKHLFPAQSIFGTHLLLFKTLFKSFLLESLILSVLATTYIMNFEFDRGTYLLTYSTKRGRKLWVDKLMASLITSVVILTLILGIGLLSYFTIFSYKEFWHVPISSFFNAGKGWFMSWWNLSFLEYLAAAVGLAYLLIILFTLMTVIISRWVHNSYLVFFLFIVLFGCIFASQGLTSTSNISFIFGYFTPVSLILNSFIWFMFRPVTITAYYESITVAVWFVILLSATVYCVKSFRKYDLK
jgi:hypothetical protein